MKRRWWMASIVACLAGCGADETFRADATLQQAGLASAGPASLEFRRRARSAPAAEGAPMAVTADQLFNWAQMNFPAYFPEHLATQATEEWSYRGPYSNGALVGIHAPSGHIYATKGPFGEGLVDLGRPADYLAPPIAVLPSSSENRHRTDLPISRTWTWAVTQRLQAQHDGFIQARSQVWADFLQTGKPILLTAVLRQSARYKGQWKWDLPSKIVLLDRKSDDEFEDVTAKLIPLERDREGCITASYSLVADFNHDGRPDVFFACTGMDFPSGPGETWNWTDMVSSQFALISQTDGTYRRWTSAEQFLGHHCSAADLTGDGHVDVVCIRTTQSPIVYVGDGRGGFTADTARFSDARAYDGKNCTGAEALKVFGSAYDVLVSCVSKVVGSPAGSPETRKSYLYRNDGRGRFAIESAVELLNPKTTKNPEDDYHLVLDSFMHDGRLYTYQADGVYNSWIIMRTDPATMRRETIHEHLGTVPPGVAAYQYVPSLVAPTSDGFIVDGTMVQVDNTWDAVIAEQRALRVPM